MEILRYFEWKKGFFVSLQIQINKNKDKSEKLTQDGLWILNRSLYTLLDLKKEYMVGTLLTICINDFIKRHKTPILLTLFNIEVLLNFR